MKDYITRYKKTLLTIAFFVGIFLICIPSLRDPDIWFHLKSGELISQKGIIHYDVFSHSAQGREWFPYEWLFQVSMYQIQHLFGLAAIPYTIALVMTVQTGLLYVIFRKIFHLQRLYSYGVITFFIISNYELIVARPHVVAYTFLLAVLAILLFYTLQKKNFLWMTIPITLAWANLHGSIFLDIALYGAFSSISYVSYALSKDRAHLKQGHTLTLYTVLTAMLTILPPLGFTQYRLLWIFFKDRAFITTFIDEWTPLTTHNTVFLFYTTVAVAIVTASLATLVYKKRILQNLWIFPLLIFVPAAYTASRNLYLAYITLALLCGWTLAQWQTVRLKGNLRLVAIAVFLPIIGFYLWLFTQKRIQDRLYYPVNAVQFIKTHHIAGNMFNEYGYGGYLLYNLYPEQKVFYDGRSDVYLCCEMRDTLELSIKKLYPDPEYKKLLDHLWDKYHISFALMRPEKHIVLRRIARMLTDDPTWRLVFWDDQTQLFIRLDGKNDAIVEKFGALAATPYNKNPFRPNQADAALAEYQQMVTIADSARSRNAIGYILLEKKNINDAIPQFERALVLDPTFESPYMNLAEIAASRGDIDQAIAGYQRALALAPDRGLIYIRLGELMIKKNNDIEGAKALWQMGIKKTIDEDAKAKLEQLVKQ